MEKKHFVKIVTTLVTVLLKMTLCLFIDFVFTKNPLFKIDRLNFTIYILTILTCPLKTCAIRLLNLVSTVFFALKDHSFSLVFLYNFKEKAENK